MMIRKDNRLKDRIAVIGAGGWGIAITHVLSENGHDVTIWSRSREHVDRLSNDRKDDNILPGVVIDKAVRITCDMQEAVKDAAMIVMVVPSAHIRETARIMKPFVTVEPYGKQIIVNCSKGIEKDTHEILTDVIRDEIPGACTAVLSGPSHAEEVGRGMPTTIVAGAYERETARHVQDVFMNRFFRVYINPDVKGIELGGALKNVIALAAGIADGLGYGDNTKAALITRGEAELTRLGMAIGGKRETFNGLSGMGDLIVTCASMHSRNRRAGILIGKGYTMQQAMDEVKTTVEGVYSAKAALELSREYGVDMPIVEQVNAVLFDGKSAGDAVGDLMLRDKKTEYCLPEWK